MKRSKIVFTLFMLVAASAACARPAAAQQSPSWRVPFAQVKQAQPGDADQTLRAMRDELERSKERLRIENQERPYFLEYRLVDVDVHAVTSSFGALVNSSTSRSRYMSVDVRVGDYMLDSSNFISDDGFRGFIGSTGQVGIDRDYDSLRQDLWLATDQAYKEALVRLSRKQGYVSTLARKPDIPDFSRVEPIVLVKPRLEPDWTSRNWDEEAKLASSAFRGHADLYDSRVVYYLVYTTLYLMNSEGTQVRVSRSLAAIEASADTQSDDGMRLHHYYTSYAQTPAALPAAATVRDGLDRVSRELDALRTSAPATDYAGPVFFDAPASAALLAQMLGPSLSGARPPLAMMPVFDQMMDRMGGRSEWMGRLNTRVFPQGVSLVDDPTATEYKATRLLGGYDVDEEGMRGERVTIVDDGTLRNLLMSRRPGTDFARSNGHGRAAFLGEPRPAMSNLFFEAKQTEDAAALRSKFLASCKAEGREWCVAVRRMDNPALSMLRQDDFSDTLAGLAGGIGTGDRLPLLVYKVFVSDGHEELVRGSRLSGLTLKVLRRIEGIGSDSVVYAYFQNQASGFAGTALAAFGSAQGGIPSSVIAPSLLLGDVEVRGARGEPQRLPLVPPPPLQ